ncbi:hypothetical protein BJV82DRAFT_609525 [Fennellomyces sp. T-0311]|nr:hypothetical protein BJV82DRAFT_609525 [Fennellomyces sp. T-0311]
MSEEAINKELTAIQDDALKVAREVENYTRKLMVPIWEKRRGVIKKIPNFWAQAIGNSPIFSMDASDSDVEALENLTDFHVEYDESRPDYRKITATFSKNDVFKNETLTKEFIINDDGEDEILSKSTIDYHPGKAPNNKRKADDDDGPVFSFVEFFGNDDTAVGNLLSDDIFPGALEYFHGEEDDDEDADEIDLGSEDEDDEDEKPAPKKSKK